MKKYKINKLKLNSLDLGNYIFRNIKGINYNFKIVGYVKIDDKISIDCIHKELLDGYSFDYNKPHRLLFWDDYQKIVNSKLFYLTDLSYYSKYLICEDMNYKKELFLIWDNQYFITNC